jgi:hypothetical protein
VNTKKEIKQMRNFDRCNISSSFFDSDHVGMIGSEFAFPGSVPSRNALLENREVPWVESLSLPIFHESFLLPQGFFPESKEISSQPPC